MRKSILLGIGALIFAILSLAIVVVLARTISSLVL